jgi:glycosyltransferase involved in cell wall biosynthesis
MELIFVDDGSNDNTLSSIMNVIPHLDINCRVFHHEWRGLGYSRNVALRNAEGDYIVWVDDGVEISRKYIRQNVHFLEKNNNVAIVKGLIDFYCGKSLIAALENMIGLAFYYNNVEKFTSKIPGTGGSVYRVKAANQVGGFDENIRGANEDTDIAFRLISKGWKVFITKARFSLVYNEKFKKVWSKNVWYGYGSHFALHKHKELGDILYKSTPLAGFLEGLFVFPVAYKLTRRKIALLLPFFVAMRRTAFCIGFVKSHFDSYGHRL